MKVIKVPFCNWFYRAALVAVMTISQLSFAGYAMAQTGSSSTQVKPGDPIYLDEPEVIAKPTLVRRETHQEKYDDGKKRVEREVAYYSDNHFKPMASTASSTRTSSNLWKANSATAGSTASGRSFTKTAN